MAVTLLRLIQFKKLKGSLNAGEIIDFIKKFNVHYLPKECINLLTSSAVAQTIAKTYKAPVDNYYLTHAQIERMMHP